LSDRTILDTLGDTRFIDLTGVRSFNAILQEQNEGRNDVFSKTIQAALTKLPADTEDLIQDANNSAAILYDNYELYAVQTIFGPAIAVYDTLNSCWSSFDINQTNGKRIKQFAKIELTIQRLYAITEDDKLYTLYIGPDKSSAAFRTISMSRCGVTEDAQTIQQSTPRAEVKLSNFRCVLDRLTEDVTMTVTPFVNNRLTLQSAITKSISYTAPALPYTGSIVMPDVDTQLNNLLFTFLNTGQGWQAFVLVQWTGGVIKQFSMEAEDITPMNPMLSQGVTQ